MASIKLGVIVSDIRGKIGGNVFARGANGMYVKSLSKPINRMSELQQVKRNNLSVYAGKWRGLSDENRDQWIQNAAQHKYRNRVGDVSQYTGFQWFMKTNMILETAALDQ